MPGDSDSAPHDPDLAAKILDNVRDTVPLAIEQIDTMLRLIAAARPDNVERILDLGCGDGVLSAAILAEHPQARACLVDLSDAVLASARHRLHPFADRVDFIAADFRAPGWTSALAHAAPFDAVVSGFAAQHSPDSRKHELFAEVFQLLKPGGIFISIEHVASATRWTESVWDDCTIDAIFGKELKASPGKSRAEVAREYYASTGGHTASPAPLEVQCDWLRELGFENVDCYLKVQELALFGGQKPAAGCD